ncbi:hypothetical protein B0H65DRAFT_564348 [Neurospora tetraspora]|uniref:Uncharacterized protein n=1 Tax=Neurospora tetraspora TaxID=94610 RepID=A0AAE0JQG9_9PEZI|nr:hypothetical protein B0H65DRAFT_564348 [Neurospora tetraspora]
MATHPHGREVENTLDNGSAAKAEKPAELEATHDHPQGELVTNQDSSALIAENQRLKAKIQELLKELEIQLDNEARNYKRLAEIRQNHTEIEQSQAAERQAATERIAMLEAECNFLRDDNKQMDINHRDALSALDKWKDRYHDQQQNMRVLRGKSEWLEDQLNIAQHDLTTTKTDEARIAVSERQAVTEELTELKQECKQLKDQLTATRNERNSEQQAANNKISEVSKECGRLRKQIDTIQSELAAKVEEAREAETWREAATRRAAKIEEEREKLKEQVATAQGELTTQAKKVFEAEVKKKADARRVTELEEECKWWKKELYNCKNQLDVEGVSKAAFGARLEQASKRIREFEEECNRLKEKMTADTKNASDQISELKIECQMHRRRATDLEQECLGYKKQVAIIECQLETAIEERSQERVATAERKLATKTAEAHEANVNLQAAGKRVNELERWHWKRSDNEMSALKEQVATAEGQLATKTEEAHEANVKLKDAVKRIHELEIMSKRTETEISTQKTLLSLATAAKAARTTKLEQASKQIRELQEQNEHLRKEQTETAAEKNQALDQVAKLKKECRLYKEQANKVEEEL